MVQLVFLDPDRVIAQDLDHSQLEDRYYCFGKVKKYIMTVRFTYRENIIRTIDPTDHLVEFFLHRFF